MKPTLAILLLCLFYNNIKGQSSHTDYNKTLADSLGADEYGMKNYVLVLLKTGSAKMEDKRKTDSLFAGHLANIGRLAKAGQLIVAGPLGKNEKSYRGIFILDVKTLAAADELLATDPAIKEKLLEAELYTWYGSAALPLYLPSHDKIQKRKF